MSQFRTIVFAAALTGLAAGLFVTAAQEVGTVPLILQAEGFEHPQAAPAAGETASTEAGTAAAHDHGSDDTAESAWQPEEGLERHAWTAVANIVTGVAFALLLVAGFALTGRRVDWREGLLWGMAGFATFTLAPSLGLPPELPGTVAAPVEARQLWWVMTAAATATGLSLLAFRRTPFWAVVAVLLLVVPHLVGAPQPDEPWSAVPEAIAHRFVALVTVTSFLFWVVLGVLGAIFYGRLSRGHDAAAAAPRPLQAA